MYRSKDTREYGKKLRELRGQKSKAEVAKAIGISESSYIKYERNERTPSDEIKVRIAKYFGKTVQDIFFSHVEHK